MKAIELANTKLKELEKLMQQRAAAENEYIEQTRELNVKILSVRGELAMAMAMAVKGQ